MRLLSPDAGSRRGDFGYGNARLRARRSGLLSRADYDALLDRDVDAILGALSETPYGPEVEAALTRHHGVQRLHEAVRRHLARSLEEMRSFYEGRARELVDVLLSRWDLHNTVTLMRGEATAPHTEESLGHVYPMGSLSDALAREIARQNEFAAAVQLLVRWKLPDPETARGLRDAWPEYERTGDLPALEHAVAANWTARTAETLRERDGAALRRFFERETDEQNVLVALRLRDAIERGELSGIPASDEWGAYLPGGSVRPEKLDDAVRFPDAGAAANSLAAGGPGDRWRLPLERWAGGGNLLALQKELEERRISDAVSLFTRGDPLGLGVPVAYAVAKENEAKNLRLVAEGAARGLNPELIRSQIFVPEEIGGSG